MRSTTTAVTMRDDWQADDDQDFWTNETEIKARLRRLSRLRDRGEPPTFAADHITALAVALEDVNKQRRYRLWSMALFLSVGHPDSHTRGYLRELRILKRKIVSAIVYLRMPARDELKSLESKARALRKALKECDRLAPMR